MPLSSSIRDAYYVVSDSSHDPGTAAPNTMWLGLASLNTAGCDASLANQGQSTQLGEILRVLPSDTDPIDGKPYSQLYPAGITLGKYYYAYVSWTHGRTCAPQAQLETI